MHTAFRTPAYTYPFHLSLVSFLYLLLLHSLTSFGWVIPIFLGSYGPLFQRMCFFVFVDTQQTELLGVSSPSLHIYTLCVISMLWKPKQRHPRNCFSGLSTTSTASATTLQFVRPSQRHDPSLVKVRTALSRLGLTRCLKWRSLSITESVGVGRLTGGLGQHVQGFRHCAGL